MKWFTLFIAFILIFKVSTAQIYQGDGRLIYANELVNNANGNAAEINPAILGGTKVTSSSFNLLQVGFRGYSNALNRGELMDFMFSDDSIPEIRRGEIVDGLIEDNGNFEFSGSLDINWISLSWTKPGFGGLSFHISDKIFSDVNLKPGLTDVLFIGSEADALNPLDEDTDLATEGESNINYTHIREMSFTYGRQAFETDAWKLNIGLNYRVLWGIGHFDSEVDGTNVEEGNSSFSEFYQINYGNLDSLFTDVAQNLFATSGKGQSLSAGVSVDWNDKFHFGVSILNLGSVSWDKNVLQADEADLRDIDSTNSGYDTYDTSAEFDEVYDALGFEVQDEGEDFQTGSKGKLRVNAHYQMTKGMRGYFDIIVPVGSNDRALYGPSYIVGLDYAIIPDAFHISTGVQYSREVGYRVPLGVSVSLGTKAFLSVSTGDARTLFDKSVENPLNSLSVSLIGVNVQNDASETDALGWR